MKKSGGILITFEGPEGSGKSTQSRRLAAWLRRQGYAVLVAREPGGTRIGRQLRRILLDPRSGALDSFTELSLYIAARAELVRQVLRPALKAGKVVLLDRFQDSTWVYQGYAGRVDRKLVERLGQAALGEVVPKLTILLDLPVRIGLKRVTSPNRFEAKPVAYHNKVRKGYRVLQRREPKRIRLIRADQSAEQVQQQIRKEVQNFLS